jgi:hypothetical protein
MKHLRLRILIVHAIVVGSTACARRLERRQARRREAETRREIEQREALFAALRSNDAEEFAATTHGFLATRSHRRVSDGPAYTLINGAWCEVRSETGSDDHEQVDELESYLRPAYVETSAPGPGSYFPTRDLPAIMPRALPRGVRYARRAPRRARRTRRAAVATSRGSPEPPPPEPPPNVESPPAGGRS